MSINASNVEAEVLAGLIGAATLAGTRWAVKTGRLMGKVLDQFGNNGGTTMRDSIDRIEDRQIRTEGHLAKVVESVEAVNDRVSMLETPAKPAPRPRKVVKQ